MSITPAELRLAGEIAAQFRHLPVSEAGVVIADHIRSFWDPRMRAQLVSQVTVAGAGCDPVLARAARQLEQA